MTYISIPIEIVQAKPKKEISTPTTVEERTADDFQLIVVGDLHLKQSKAMNIS